MFGEITSARYIQKSNPEMKDCSLSFRSRTSQAQEYAALSIKDHHKNQINLLAKIATIVEDDRNISTLIKVRRKIYTLSGILNTMVVGSISFNLPALTKMF